MRYVVVGATGTVGAAIVRSLVADEHQVTVLSRRPDRAHTLHRSATVVGWSALPSPDVIEALRGADVVIDLAGASIGTRPWTAGRKREIVASRLAATGALVDAMGSLPPADRPSVLVNASGIDYYGDRPDDEILSESSPAGTSFLAEVCVAWEAAAMAARALGVRVVTVRTSVVIASDAPAFRLMCLPFRLGVGGPLGSGAQLFTWIHIDDLVGIYRLAATDPTIDGPINAVAPDIRSQAEAARVIGAILHRPAGLRLPAGILRLAMRDQADILLHGRCAEPRVAIEHGYRFTFPAMDVAFADVLGRARDAAPAPLDSPFERGVFTTEPLAEAFREQFLGSPDDGDETFFSGRMDTVWRRHAWLRPVFSLLARTDTLFPETGADVPATMTVRSHRTDDGRPWQSWERTFDFGHVRRRFDASVTFDAVRGQAVEHTGPRRRLETPWRVELVDGRLTIDTEAVYLRVGGMRIRMPRLLSVGATAIQTIDPSKPDHIHIDLSLSNPLLGPVFGYAGTFRVERRPRT